MIWLLAACMGSANAVRPASAVTIDCQGKDAEVAQDDQVVTPASAAP